MEKISWTDRVGNKEVSHTVKGTRKILLAIKRRKANLICNMLRRKYFLIHIIDGNPEGGDRSDRKKS
jgi:hypothetical protein